MKPLLYPTDLRQWWWSKQPWWNYATIQMRTGAVQGWINLVDIHPGLFNLAWMMSGVTKPPLDYSESAHLTEWVFTNAFYIPMAGRTMADWAFDTTLADFKYVLESDEQGVRRWKFRNYDMSYDKIIERLSLRTADRARL